MSARKPSHARTVAVYAIGTPELLAALGIDVPPGAEVKVQVPSNVPGVVISVDAPAIV